MNEPIVRIRKASLSTRFRTPMLSQSMKRFLLPAIAGLGLLPVAPADADIGAGVRVSTLGFGADIDFSASKWATIRVGYNGINYGREFTDTNVTYDGKIKISTVSAIIDWNVFAGGFHVSVGAASNGPKVDLVGRPTNGTFTFNGNTYQASDIGSATGSIYIGKSVAPYVGLGWGNAASDKHSLTFLFDIGALHTGSISTTLAVSCNPALPTATCDQLTTDAHTEKTDLETKASRYRWYPVVGLGVGVKF